MKRKFTIGSVALFLLCCVFPVHASLVEKVTPPKSPMLWKIEKKGKGPKLAYLFGTVHFSGNSVKKLHAKAEAVYSGANRIYFEADLSRRGTLKLQEYVKRPKGSSLIASLGKSNVSETDAVLKKYAPKLNVKMFDGRKTWAFWTTLSYAVNCGAGGTTMDSFLYHRALNEGKSVFNLESNDEQLGGLNKLSEGEQKALVLSYTKYLKTCLKKEVHPSRKLFDAYLSGDEEDIIEAINRSAKNSGNNKSISSKLKRIMLDKRNKRMAAKIDLELEKFPSKSHFFAVGVSHYLGNNSIIGILRKKGYTITRIQK